MPEGPYGNQQEGSPVADPIDTVAEFLHTGGPPLAADDAAAAIIGALLDAGYVVVPSSTYRGAVEEIERLREAIIDVAQTEHERGPGGRFVKAERALNHPGGQSDA